MSTPFRVIADHNDSRASILPDYKYREQSRNSRKALEGTTSRDRAAACICSASILGPCLLTLASSTPPIDPRQQLNVPRAIIVGSTIPRRDASPLGSRGKLDRTSSIPWSILFHRVAVKWKRSLRQRRGFASVHEPRTLADSRDRDREKSWREIVSVCFSILPRSWCDGRGAKSSLHEWNSWTKIENTGVPILWLLMDTCTWTF